MSKTGIVLLTIGALIAVSGYITFSSIASAPSRVVVKTLQTDNIINNYEWFFNTQAAYNTRVSQISQYKTLLTEEVDNSERQRLRIELSGMQQVCRDLSQRYNANSQKMNVKIFKDWTLPPEIEPLNCEIN